MNILLVDDSATMRKILLRSIQQAGVDASEILEASNGNEALKIIESSSVDLILSDINMPELDGFGLLERVKSNEATKAIPVIMVTSESAPAIVSQARRAGAAGHIQKPFKPDQIKEVILKLAA